VFNPETETLPMFLHFNGDRRPMAPFVKEMWPSLTWDDPQVRNAIFSVWGEPTAGRHLCTIPLAPAPVRPKGKGTPAATRGPNPFGRTKVSAYSVFLRQQLSESDEVASVLVEGAGGSNQNNFAHRSSRHHLLL